MGRKRRGVQKEKRSRERRLWWGGKKGLVSMRVGACHPAQDFMLKSLGLSAAFDAKPALMLRRKAQYQEKQIDP